MQAQRFRDSDETLGYSIHITNDSERKESFCESNYTDDLEIHSWDQKFLEQKISILAEIFQEIDFNIYLHETKCDLQIK